MLRRAAAAACSSGVAELLGMSRCILVGSDAGWKGLCIGTDGLRDHDLDDDQRRAYEALIAL